MLFQFLLEPPRRFVSTKPFKDGYVSALTGKVKIQPPPNCPLSWQPKVEVRSRWNVCYISAACAATSRDDPIGITGHNGVIVAYVADSTL